MRTQEIKKKNFVSRERKAKNKHKSKKLKRREEIKIHQAGAINKKAKKMYKRKYGQKKRGTVIREKGVNKKRDFISLKYKYDGTHVSFQKYSFFCCSYECVYVFRPLSIFWDLKPHNNIKEEGKYKKRKLITFIRVFSLSSSSET